MIVSNPTSRWTRDERTHLALRWNGNLPKNSDISYGLWLVRQLSTAPGLQVALADLAREWDESLRDNSIKAETCRALGIDDGWWALSYWASCANALNIEVVHTGGVSR